MECAEVNVLQPQVCDKVQSISAVVRPIFIARVVEETFVTRGHQVERIDRLHERGHLVHPVEYHLHIAAIRATGQVPRSIGSATRLVAKLPCKDRWRVLVAIHNRAYVVLVRVDDAAIIEELIVVLAAEVDGVHIHATVVCPVVGERNQELHALAFSKADNLVEVLETRWVSICD